MADKDQQPTLNGAQLQKVQEHLQQLLKDVNLRKWAVDAVLSHAGNRPIDEIVKLSEQMYEFVAQPIEPK